MKAIEPFLQDFADSLGVPPSFIYLETIWGESPPEGVEREPLRSFLKDVGSNTHLYEFYHNFDDFRDKYEKLYGRRPYANRYTQWRWDVAKDITFEMYEEGMRRLDVYKEWLLQQVMQVDKFSTYMILPISTVEENYRDRKTEPPTYQNTFDSLYLAPTMGAPELVVPVDVYPYHSRVSGRQEELPIAVYVLSAPDTDKELIDAVFRCLESSSRSTRVSTGSKIFDF